MLVVTFLFTVFLSFTLAYDYRCCGEHSETSVLDALSSIRTEANGVFVYGTVLQIYQDPEANSAYVRITVDQVLFEKKFFDFSHSQEIVVKKSCSSLVSLKIGSKSTFFATFSRDNSGNGLNFIPCSPTVSLTKCQLSKFTHGVPSANDWDSDCTSDSNPHTPSHNTPPKPCECTRDGEDYANQPLGTRWNEGICTEARCFSKENGGCYVSRTQSSCVSVIAPSVVGVALCGALLCFVIVRIVRSKRAAESELEMRDISDYADTNTNNDYSYQPVSTTAPSMMTGSQMMMQTSTGQQVLVNTHPMVMQTQTGESVVVQVAYM